MPRIIFIERLIIFLGGEQENDGIKYNFSLSFAPKNVRKWGKKEHQAIFVLLSKKRNRQFSYR